MEHFLDQIRYYDYHTYLFFHSAIHGREWLNGAYLFFAKYGIVISFLSFIYLIARIKIRAFFCTFLAMGIAITINILIALVWKRQRPFISHQDEILRPITEGLKVDPISFPSGHTYIAFAIATSVFLYGHKKLGSFLFLVAILIAIGRIGAGLHYPSDVVAGALLGIASGIFAYMITCKAQKDWAQTISFE